MLLSGRFRGLFFVFFLSCSCTKRTQEPIVLKVGDKSWNLATYKKELSLKLKSISSIEKKSKSDFQKIKQDLIQDLILKSLIENWAEKNQIKTETLIPSLKNKNFESHVKDGALHKALLDSLSKKIPKPSLLKQKKYYMKNKKKFYVGASCFLEHILVASESLSKKLLQEIKDGSSFKKLKFLHSSKSDVGWVEIGTLDVFDQACRLDINSISPVLKSSFGYHIFKIMKKRQPVQKKFRQVQNKILQILLEKPKKKQFQKWLETEVSKSSVFIHTNLLDKIHIQYKSNLL